MPIPFIIGGIVAAKAVVGGVLATTAAKVAIGVTVATLTYKVVKLTLSKIKEILVDYFKKKGIEAQSARVAEIINNPDKTKRVKVLGINRNKQPACDEVVVIPAEEISDDIYEGKCISLVS